MIKYFKKVKITNNMNDNRSVYYVFTECQLIIMNIFFAMSHLFQQIFLSSVFTGMQTKNE